MKAPVKNELLKFAANVLLQEAQEEAALAAEAEKLQLESVRRLKSNVRLTRQA